MSKEAALATLAAIPVTPEATPDAAPVVADPAAPAPELDSTRFSHLAKKEAELVRSREAFKKEQTQFMTDKQKVAEIQRQLSNFNELKTKDPVAALKQMGFSETDLFNYMANQEAQLTPEERAASAAQAEIKKFTDAQAKKEADAQNQRNTNALNNFRQDITKVVAADPVKYEYCAFNGALAEQLIYDTVSACLQEDLKTNPKALPISTREAAEMVEQYYEDQDKEMSNLKKRQPRQDAAPVDAPLKPQVSPRPSPPRTLNGKTSATVSSTVPVPRTESPDAKKARLVKKYFGAPQ